MSRTVSLHHAAPFCRAHRDGVTFALLLVASVIAGCADDDPSKPCGDSPCDAETTDIGEDCDSDVCSYTCIGEDCADLCDGDDCGEAEVEICVGELCPCVGDSCIDFGDDGCDGPGCDPEPWPIDGTSSQQPLLFVTLPTGEQAWMSLAVVGTTTSPELNGSPAFAHFGGVMPVALP